MARRRGGAAGQSDDDDGPPVGVFWDYENVRFPSQYTPHPALARLRDLALSKGRVQVLKAYMDTEHERAVRTTALRAQLAQSGWQVQDCPHDGKKDVADKMLMTDALVFALTQKGPTVVIMITGDRDFAYTLSTLRMHRCQVILLTTPSASVSLRQSAHEVLDWRSDILQLAPKLPAERPPLHWRPQSEKAKKAAYFTHHQQATYSYSYSSTTTTSKPGHSSSATHASVLDQRLRNLDNGSKRMPPALVPAQSHALHHASSSRLPLIDKPAPLGELDLSGDTPTSKLRAWSDEPPRSVGRIGGKKPKKKEKGSRKGKERAVEVIELSDKETGSGGDEIDDDDSDLEFVDSSVEIAAPPSRPARGNSTPLPRRSPPPSLHLLDDSFSFFRDPMTTRSKPSSAAASHPPSAMDMSPSGSSSPPAGRIEVLYSLPGSTSKKRRREAAEQNSDPADGTPLASPRKKRARAASVPVEEPEEVEEEENGDEDDAADVDSDDSDDLIIAPATPFSPSSTTSSRYDLLIHPSTSDAEASPLVRRRGKASTSTARRGMRGAAARSKLGQEVRDDEDEENEMELLID
ncbi:hypothetical protein JCM8097_001899 [Rhodosporidiobolus ruineniae]